MRLLQSFRSAGPYFKMFINLLRWLPPLYPSPLYLKLRTLTQHRIRELRYNYYYNHPP